MLETVSTCFCVKVSNKTEISHFIMCHQLYVIDFFLHKNNDKSHYFSNLSFDINPTERLIKVSVNLRKNMNAHTFYGH